MYVQVFGNTEACTLITLNPYKCYFNTQSYNMNVLDQLCVQGKWSRSTFPPHSMTPTLLIPSLASVLNCLVSTAATAQAAAGSITSFIRSHTYNT